jgi:hypothetical protein
MTSFSLEMRTKAPSGLLIWIGQDVAEDDYLGIGLQNGMLHLVWDLGWFSRTEFTVPRPKMNDGEWHAISVDRVRQSLELRIDGEVYGSQVSGSYFELNTDGHVFIGAYSGTLNRTVSYKYLEHFQAAQTLLAK